VCGDTDAHGLEVRNGYQEQREAMTAAGAVPVRTPRVSDKRVHAETGERKRFSPVSIVPA
jgi:hypothetical protein